MKRLRVATLLVILALAGCATAPRALPPVSDKQAVVSLVESALAERDAGRLDTAVVRLERALHIEPRNAMIWHYLATVRFQEAELDKAEALAVRANSFAGANRAVRAANWRLIGQIRAMQGNPAGAQAAFDQANALER